MTDDRTQYTLDRLVRLVISVVVLVALLALLRYLSDVLLPFAAAVVLAYLLNPLVTLFERKTRRRGLAVALTICGLCIVGLAAVAIMVPLAASQVSRFQRDIASLRDDLAASAEADPSRDAATPPAAVEAKSPDDNAANSPAAPEAEEDKSALGWRELMDGWAESRTATEGKTRSERFAVFRSRLEGTYIGDMLDRAIEYTNTDEFNQLLINAAKGIIAGGWSVVTFVVSFVLGLTGVIIVLLYLIFLLLDYPEYARTWDKFLPPKYRDSIVEFLAQFSEAMRRYFRGQAVIAILMGALFTVGFTIIGLPMAVPCGMFVGLLNMVPYLQTVGLVPAIMLAGLRAVEGDSSFAVSVVLTLLVFAIAQLIQDAVITPRIMGDATGLKPVAILLGVFIWGKLLGFLGLVLAIPLTCLAIAYYRRFVLAHSAEPAGVSSS
ncbi:MAG: AI-2E family transporter [Phycisphaerales bacterium]|nr:MAG: AI-2E family transporter [Phycisphaerales bacterium]